MTFHMSENKVRNNRKILKTPKTDIYCRQKTILHPKQQEIIMFKLETDKQNKGILGAIIPDSKLENDFDLALTSALVTISSENKNQILAVNLSDHPVIINRGIRLVFLKSFYPYRIQ